MGAAERARLLPSRWLLLPLLLHLETMWSLQCPDIDDDPNGSWEGSREVGGNFTLSCTRGFKVPGTSGKSSVTLSCPESFQWTEELRCVNIDDCAKLKHGCGAFGICTDKTNGYDCNCEQGYPPRRSDNGEIICGNMSTDMRLCGGHTCGAYGVCIDLKGDLPKFEQAQAQVENPVLPNHTSVVTIGRKTTYRCECTDGYYDDGDTCVPYDCGRLTDELGIWSGSTLFGGEYTLECPPEASIWSDSSHTARKRITITCGKKGKWLTLPVCHSEAREAQELRMEAMRRWSCLSAVFVCICSAATAAGLTLGLATLEPFSLTVLLATNPDHCSTPHARMKLQKERSEARRVLPIVRDHHHLLVTLLLFNTVANESLPIFLDELVPSWAAVLISVSVVLICGEILPSAVFTGPSQMSIAATCVPLVRVLLAVFYVIAKPIARVLDHVIEQDDAEDSVKYSRAELLALLQLHTRRPPGAEDSTDVHDLDDSMLPVTGHDDALLSASPTRMLLCCSADEVMDADVAHDCQEIAEDPHCLAASELKLINGAMCLREASLDLIPYARLHQCALARAEDRAADAIASNVLRPGVRALLVTSGSSSGSSGSRPPQLVMPSESNFALVPVSAVAGCLRPLELLRGGNRTLGSLCAQPLVLIPDTGSALGALQIFQSSGTASGLVVSDDKVCGVVTSTDILSFVMRRLWRGDDASTQRWPSSQGFSPGQWTGISSSMTSLDHVVREEPGDPRPLITHRSKSKVMTLGPRVSLIPRSSSSFEKVLYRSYTGDGTGPNSFCLSRRGTGRFLDVSP